ncbi:DUF3397 family protein [Enterococcus hirae]|nr:DUF3397 family protein [Enterococcus hirae]
MKFHPILLFWYVFPIFVLLASTWVLAWFYQRFPTSDAAHPLKPIDLSLPFLLIGLGVLSKMAFGRSIVPFVILIILIIGAGLAIYQVHNKKELDVRRFIKVLWRIAFLWIAFLYAVFMLVTLVQIFL